MSNGANHNTSPKHTKLLGRFCETPKAFGADADTLQLSHGMTGPIRHLYVHIPFCARICPYCAFYKDLLDRPHTWRFCEAILRELELYQGGAIFPGSPEVAVATEGGKSFRRTRERRSSLLPSTIYFGGGTPTALTIAQLELLLRGFRERLNLSCLEEW